jgi:UDP-2,3-diacylglucosamine pyrophosphatase LpxH
MHSHDRNQKIPKKSKSTKCIKKRTESIDIFKIILRYYFRSNRNKFIGDESELGSYMLAVISDLHFQDTINDVIKDEKDNILVGIDRNVSSEAFRLTFQEILSMAEGNSAQELIIVLAGDIFDLNRSQIWFEKDNDNIRPYGEHPPETWGPIAEKILDDIIASNQKTFDIFKNQAEAILKNDKKVRFQYIPGNHDRAINLYPPLRKKVRDLLGLGGGSGPFDHEIPAIDYGVHIRHGHEYDSFNFAGKVSEKGPLAVEVNDYDSAPLGDYVTIDFAARLAFEYRKRYEQGIKSGPDAETHRLIYRKLLEFDDLRPQSEIMSFIGSEIADGNKVQDFLAPVIKDVLQRALANKFVRDRLGALEISLAKIIKFVSTQLLVNLLIKKPAGAGPWQWAQREPVLENPKYRYVVAGHTHNPDVEFLSCRQDGKELFFFDTGTWRQQIRKCCDKETFARAKALTYVAFYRPDEDPPRAGGKKEYSFDYWSGFTKREIT